MTDWRQALKKWMGWLEGSAKLPDKQSRIKLVGALGVAAVMLIGLVAVGTVLAPSSPTRHHPASGAQVPLLSPPAPSTTVPNPVAAPGTTAVPRATAAPNTGGSTAAATPAAARGTLTASKRVHSRGRGQRGRKRAAGLHRPKGSLRTR